MEIQGEDYQVTYEPRTGTVTFRGVMRLFLDTLEPRDMEGFGQVGEVGKLMDKVVADALPIVTLDLRQLRHLNSVGIAKLMKLAIKLHQQGKSKIVVRGNPQVLWQTKLAGNLTKIIPTTEVDWE